MRKRKCNDIISNVICRVLLFSFGFRKAVNEQKELKLLLDMYKGVNKDKRDKVQLMQSERKLKAELEEVKQQMRRLQVPNSF